MKRIFKIVALCIALVMLLQPVMALATVEETDDGSLILEEVEAISQREDPAKKAYNELINAWRDEHDLIQYPDAFGGAYLDSDYRLAINVVGMDPVFCQQATLLVSSPEILVFHNTDISYSDLFDLFIEVSKQGIAPSSTHLDPKNSYVEVSIMGKEGISSILRTDNLIKDKHVKYNYTEELYESSQPTSVNSVELKEAPTATTAANPGALLTLHGKNEDGTPLPNIYEEVGSIGLFGKYYFNGKGTPVLVTAGHVVWDFINQNNPPKYAANAYYDYSGNVIVFASSWQSSSDCYIQYANNQPGDFAFVAYDTSLFSPSADMRINYSTTRQYKNVLGLEYLDDADSIAYTEQIAKNVYMPLQGTSIFKAMGVNYLNDTPSMLAGTIGSYSVLRRVDSFSGQGKIDITLLCEITSSKQFCNPGDSGCTVFGYQDGLATVYGIIEGHDATDETDESPKISYFSPMPQMILEGFVPYPWCDQ